MFLVSGHDAARRSGLSATTRFAQHAPLCTSTSLTLTAALPVCLCASFAFVTDCMQIFVRTQVDASQFNCRAPGIKESFFFSFLFFFFTGSTSSLVLLLSAS